MTDLRPHLVEAYDRGLNARDLKALVDAGADLESTGGDGGTLLIRAAAVGDLELINMLMAAGATVESRNRYGQSPLVAATCHRQNAAAAALIAAGADDGYALAHLRATGQWDALDVLAEVCSNSLKEPYRYGASPRGPSPASLQAMRDRIYRYPFCPDRHVAAGQVLLDAGHIAEAIFHLEVACSLDQLDLKAQRLLHQSYVQRRGGPLCDRAEEDLKQRFCPVPFEQMISSADGRAYVCCPSWLPVSIGKAGEGDWKTLWNSPQAQDIRRSILDGSFRYCSRLNCPEIQASKLPLKSHVTDAQHRLTIDCGRVVLDDPPRGFVLGHDLTCNLSCPSCRTRVYAADPQDLEQHNRLCDDLLFPLLRHLRLLQMSGSGEFLASRHCLEVLQRIDAGGYPDLKLALLTNAVLFTPQRWQELTVLHGRVAEVHVSIDSPNALTYEALRRGARFDTTMANLEFIAALRQRRQFNLLRLNLIVQKANYLEMKAFIEMGKRLGADTIRLSHITDWGTYSLEQFRDADIASPSHGDYEKFLKVLRDPIFADKAVDLYNIYEHWKFAHVDHAKP